MDSFPWRHLDCWYVHTYKHAYIYTFGSQAVVLCCSVCFFAYAMAPSSIACCPKHACGNFPLCNNLQKQSRLADGTRQRSSHCESCSLRARCTFSGCENFCAPSSGRYETAFCALHYGDPCNSAHRHWKLCSNSRVGCRYLAMLPRTGKCYACSNGNLPCLHSQLGCSRHARNDAKVNLSSRAPCLSKNGSKCPFDPTNSRSCASPLCGSVCVSLEDALCSNCLAGRRPCRNQCDRRTDSSNVTLCGPCLANVAEAHDTVSKVKLFAPNPPSLARSVNDTATTEFYVEVDACVGHYPQRACRNFPICRNSQKQILLPRQGDSRTHLGRLEYCSSCSSSAYGDRSCSHPYCLNPPAPSAKGKSSHGFCAFHVRDPSHASVRERPLCRNEEDIVF